MPAAGETFIFIFSDDATHCAAEIGLHVMLLEVLHRSVYRIFADATPTATVFSCYSQKIKTAVSIYVCKK
jgi:hypothetical protein